MVPQHEAISRPKSIQTDQSIYQEKEINCVCLVEYQYLFLAQIDFEYLA